MRTMIAAEISGDDIASVLASSTYNHLTGAVQVQHKPVKRIISYSGKGANGALAYSFKATLYFRPLP